VWKLESESIPVDVHLSGAMTNRLIAATATDGDPYELMVSDMFQAMPYENSLVVMEMNGPQLKEVLERAYRNYYFYKYVPGFGGYSYYTTCMLDTDAGNQIVYRDASPELPDGDNVRALLIGGVAVDFTDATTYYRVSTVNYLAAGACNFSDPGEGTLWPLDQIVADTQYYVRDAVIEYVQHQTEPISPTVEGRLLFATPAPPTVSSPTVAPEPSYEGQSVTVSAPFDDPAPQHGPFTCTVDFGDGTAPVTGTVTAMTCTAGHIYWVDGNHTVTVTVADVFGSPDWATTTHVVVPFAGPPPTLPPDGAEFTRLEGGDRYETAANVSAATFSPGVDVAFVVTGDDFADGLTAGAVGATLGAPVLLTRTSTIPAATVAELTRLAPAEIVVVGGETRVDTTVVTALEAYASGDVTRVFGADRYETAAALSAAYVASGVDEVYVATGADFADALSAAAAAGANGAPLLLVTPSGIPAATAAELTRLGPDRITLVGGETAVAPAVEAALEPFASVGVTRVAGDDRYETAAAVSAHAFTSADTAYLATGVVFADALAAGPAAALEPGPILLSRPTCIPQAIGNEIDRLGVDTVIVLGGETALSAAVIAGTTCP
jgi:putative cell wall-binding protein